MMNVEDFKNYFNNEFVDKPYYPLSAFFKKHFGHKVYKISLDGNFTCPNRDGTISTGGCIFCRNRAFVRHLEQDIMSITEQIELGAHNLNIRYKNANYFIAYFQAFSNTYKSLYELKKLYYEALNNPLIVGIAIGTRPDCLDDDILKLLSDLASKTHLWLEIGLQSKHNESLEYINRGHNSQIYYDIVKKCKNIYNLNICTHIILGLPGETEEMMKASVNYAIEAGTDAIKLHHLQVIKDTKLENIYLKNNLKVLNFNEYIKLLGNILEIIPKHIIMQRMFAECSSDILVAPIWNLTKGELNKGLDNYLIENDIFQGKKLL